MSIQKRSVRKNERIKCDHEFTWDNATLCMAYPPTVKGVCKKCGKQAEISVDEYKRLQTI